MAEKRDKKSDKPADELPALDFSTFVMSVIGSAYIHLGDAPHPDGTFGPGEGGEANLVLAQQDIQLLSLLEEKTRGNLTAEEERIISQALYDLRMRYVEVSKGQ
jgi:hypothetical protein